MGLLHPAKGALNSQIRPMLISIHLDSSPFPFPLPLFSRLALSLLSLSLATLGQKEDLVDCADRREDAFEHTESACEGDQAQVEKRTEESGVLKISRADVAVIVSPFLSNETYVDFR